MKYLVTTTADRAMSNPDQEIAAATPEAAAEQFTARAADYFDADVAADHVGDDVTKIVTDAEGNETRITAKYQ